MEIVLNNQPSEKQKAVQALVEFARARQLPASVVQAADLALEEYLTNLMNYGFADNLEHLIVIRFSAAADLVVEVQDDGRPFNPLTLPEVDTSAPLAERPIGGLGIHLMRRFMDDLQYHSHGGKNVLQMRKRLQA